MPHYPVRQPNGNLAIYSTIVDAFTKCDCDKMEAVNEILKWHLDTTPPSLHGKVCDIAAGVDPEVVCEHWNGWEYCLAWSVFMRGWDDEAVQKFLSMTPIDGRERIRLTVAQYQAESEALA